LNRFARILRNERLSNGALQLNNVKIGFDLDSKTGNPSDCFSLETKEANHLIEEFMLLSNRKVAERITKFFPDNSLLRSHYKPDSDKLQKFSDHMRDLGHPLQGTSSTELSEYLINIRSEVSLCTFFAIQIMATKSLQLATYICSGSKHKDKKTDWSHYALSMKCYTHFTSPIRRYSDIVVHRLLQATITTEDDNQPQRYLDELDHIFSGQEVRAVAKHCNDKKAKAKKGWR